MLRVSSEMLEMLISLQTDRVDEEFFISFAIQHKLHPQLQRRCMKVSIAERTTKIKWSNFKYYHI